MYISSFNTFVNVDASHKISSKRTENSKDFSFKNLQNSDEKVLSTPLKNPPINYTANNNSFASQFKLQESAEKTTQLTKKYSDSKKLQNAKKAYESGSKISFLFQKEQSLAVAVAKPHYVSALQEKSTYAQMVNTYVQNEKYYQITA